MSHAMHMKIDVTLSNANRNVHNNKFLEHSRRPMCLLSNTNRKRDQKLVYYAIIYRSTDVITWTNRLGDIGLHKMSERCRSELRDNGQLA